MNYEDFLKLIMENASEWDIGQWNDFYIIDDGSEKHNEILAKRWISGGRENGSCYGTKLQSRSPEPEPEFKALTSLLMSVAPALTFLQYQKIVEMQKLDCTTDTEYYGNYTDYNVKYIELEELYNLLVEWEYIANV